MLEDIKKELLDVYKYRYVVFSFIETNLKLRYRRSFLGFIWTVLAPMLNYLVMGLVFSFIMSGRIPSYFSYYFSGAIFFAIISSTLNRAPLLMLGNEHYIKKIYIPKMIFVLNGSIYEVVNFSLSAVSLIILGYLFDKIDLSPLALLIILPLLLITFFLVGLSCLISIAAVYFRDLIHIVPVVVQALFFLTPVIYEKKMIPTEYQYLVDLNPIYYFLEIYRQPLIFNQVPPAHYYLICTFISALTFTIGIYLIKKFDNKIIFKL